MGRLETRPSVPTPEPHEEGGLDVRRYLRLFDQRKWWLVASLSLAIVGALAYNAAQTPIYESRATLLVETGGRSSRADEGDVLQTLTGMGRARTLGTQIEIVKSRTRVDGAARIVAAQEIVAAALSGAPTVEDAGQKGAPVRPLPDWVGPETAEGVQTNLLPRIQELQRNAGLLRVDLEKLLIAASRDSLSDYPPGVQDLRAELHGTEEKPDPSATEVDRLAAAAQEWLPAVAGDCRQQLAACSVQGVRDTDVIAVTCRSVEPTVAAAYADAVCLEHEWRTLLSNREAAKRGAAWVQGQTDEAREVLDGQGEKLRQLLNESGLVSVPDAARVLTERANTLADQVSASQAAVQADTAELAALRGQLSSQQKAVVASRTTQLAAAAGEVQNRLTEAQEQRASLLEKVTEKHPSVAEIDARIGELERQLAEELTRRVDSETRVTNPLGQALLDRTTQSQVKLISDEAQLAALEGALARARTELARVPDVEKELVQLQRETQIAEKNYLALLDTLQSLTLAQVTEVAGASILDRAAVSSAPVTPNKRLNLIMAVLLGLIGGVALALLIDHLDNTLKDPEELERAFGLAVLGVIPRARTAETSVVDASDPEASSAEPYRSLRSNLRFAATDGSLGCVLVTSPGPGEGKTTTAINLAITCAEMGEGVVLVDTDLRRPTIATKLSLPNETGLTNCVVGEQPLEAMLQTAKQGGVQVLTSGPTPPNALQIIESEAMRAMIAELRKRAGLVVLDSPPVALLADAQALASLADGVVLVIELGKTRRPVLTRALDSLSRTGTRCLGVVINKAVAGKGGYGYYYYYGHYYHYGYGYYRVYGSDKGKGKS